MRRLASVAISQGKRIGQSFGLRRIIPWLTGHQHILRAVSMIASASLLATVVNIVGSLVQGRFISPQDLGFVRKYSVVSGYAIFLNLGLFSILQREYPVLMGRGENERARQTAGIVQSWCLLSTMAVCSALVVVAGWELLHSHLREAAAWGVQIVSVWSSLYVGCLIYTFRSGQDFERLARSQALSSIAGLLVFPFFVILPFPALILRSVVSPTLSGFYLHRFRPVRIGWYLPWRPFLDLVKRGLRLDVGSYLRYGFWPTVEIWLLVRFGGDAGVGVFIFSKMIVESTVQLATAVNQVFMPRLAQSYGRTGSLTACLKQSFIPTLLTLGTAIPITLLVWYLLPPIIAYAFPRYLAAIPVIRILALQTFLVSSSMSLQMIIVLESYLTQVIAALLGLAVLLGVSVLLHGQGATGTAVAWGTVAGQGVFALTCLISLLWKAKIENRG